VSQLGLANSSARLLPAGTVMLSRTASVGFSAIMACDMATTQDFVNWVCGLRITPEYLLYVFRGMLPELLRLTMGSTHQTIYMPDVARFVCPLPPPDEQASIVRFVRHRLAKIDTLVAKKERLIELLQEKRAALIARAVTKGLDPNVPMKASGVEWLGQIPRDWGLRALKRLATFRAGTAITADHISASGEYPVYGGNGIRGFTSSYTHEGDFPLIGRQGALCGCVCFASGRFWPSEHAVVVTPGLDADARWLAHLLAAMSLNTYSESAAQPGLAVGTVSTLLVPVPSLEEQRELVAVVEQVTAKIDALTSRVREGIDRLREYRTALISAAVTGKIDVREEAA